MATRCPGDWGYRYNAMHMAMRAGKEEVKPARRAAAPDASPLDLATAAHIARVLIATVLHAAAKNTLIAEFQDTNKD